MSTTEIPDVPMGPPPPGVIPNFENPPSSAWETYLTVSLCLGFMIPFVATRIYARKVVTRAMGIDDYLCALAGALTIAYAAISIRVLDFGYGIHLWDLMFSRFGDRGTVYSVICLAFHAVTNSVIKVSILLLYLRIIPIIPLIRVLVFVGIVMSVTGNLAPFIVYLVTCAPGRGETWTTAGLEQRCWGTTVVSSTVTSSFNLAMDFFILGLPLPMIWQLQLSIRKRIGVTVILMTGLVACGASLARLLIYNSHITSNDPFWYQRIVLASLIEITTGIVCSCVPGCAPLLRKAVTAFPSLASLRDWIYSKAGSSRFSRSTTQKPGSSPLVEGQPEAKVPREQYLELGEVPMDNKEPNVTSTVMHAREW